MTNEQIRQLEKELWDAADELLINSKLKVVKYKIFGLGYCYYCPEQFRRC
jgi:hypothetical protein